MYPNDVRSNIIHDKNPGEHVKATLRLVIYHTIFIRMGTCQGDPSSIYRTRSGPMLLIFEQLFTLLLCGQSQLFKVETYCSRTGAYCYGVKTYYNQQ